MPKAFDQCARAPGSIIRTKRLSNQRYMRLCKYRSGRWARGEIKKRKRPRKRNRRRARK